jgi:dephospho-CoA kinase
VASLFRNFDAEIIDADKIAHEELGKKEVKERLQSRFGNGIIDPDGSVNRRRLAEIIFSNEKDRAFLENCVHPGVRRKIEKQVVSSPSNIVVLDVPLLETSPVKKLCTHRIFVKVPEEIRWKRIQQRGWSREEWQAREKSQWPLEKKEQEADWVLNNNSPLKETLRNIENWLKRILPH